MSTPDHDDQPGTEHSADAALLATLAEQRQDRAPTHDLWAGIEARLSQVPAEQPHAAALAALRLDLKPPRDLWPEIEARIRQQRWRRLRTPLAAAAGLAASLVLVLGLQVQRGKEASSPSHPPLRPSAAVLEAMQDSLPTASALRPVSVRPLGPESRALVRANLKIVASAESQLKRALVADPDAAYLESLLASARQQKQDLRITLAQR
jgi:hypothetical protein